MKTITIFFLFFSINIFAQDDFLDIDSLMEMARIYIQDDHNNLNKPPSIESNCEEEGSKYIVHVKKFASHAAGYVPSSTYKSTRNSIYYHLVGDKSGSTLGNLKEAYLEFTDIPVGKFPRKPTIDCKKGVIRIYYDIKYAGMVLDILRSGSDLHCFIAFYPDGQVYADVHVLDDGHKCICNVEIEQPCSKSLIQKPYLNFPEKKIFPTDWNGFILRRKKGPTAEKEHIFAKYNPKADGKHSLDLMPFMERDGYYKFVSPNLCSNIKGFLTLSDQAHWELITLIAVD